VLLCGVVPFVLAIFWGEAKPVFALAFLNLIGFTAFALCLEQGARMLHRINAAAKSFGVVHETFSPLNALMRFIRETTRYHRAAYAFQLERNRKAAKLSESLWRSVTLAKKEFKAHSVELALIDQESHQFTQTMLVGNPKTAKSQAMLCGDDEGPTQVLDHSSDMAVVVKPVSFAGTAFGYLRLEVPHGTELMPTDRHVLNLLATQVGILLADAQFTQELLRMHRASEETVRAKTGFLANLSHEIRGPLGIILNGVELALDGLCGEISDDLRDTLKMMKESISHLLDLINDVLDYAKLEAGKIAAKPTEIILAHLLEDLCAVVRSQAAAKNHKLTLEHVEPGLGIRCDKRHARQMLINFLTNAVKYTPDGGTITVSVTKLRDERAKIMVHDTGVGIPEDQRSKVFAPFERVEHDYAAAQVGTGLGMPLTRRLAEVNGGVVGFDSEEGKGSVFWLILPALTIEDAVRADDGAGEHEVRRHGRGEHVLLVDHEVETRQILDKYLTGQGFHIISAASAPEVLRILREREVSLAVVENDIPGLPGEEMIAAIRSTPKAQTTPIILLSSRAFVFDVERFLKLGVDRCLSKPVPLGELAATARRLIDESRRLH